MLRAIGIAVLCSGCAQILGLDETSSLIGSIAVRLQRVSVGASVEYNPLDVGTALPSFLVTDASAPSGVRKLEAAAAERGRWLATAKAVEGVVYSYPDDPVPHLLSFPNFSGPDLRAYVTAYEHPNRNPAPSPPPNVTLNLSLPSPYAATENFAFDVIGVWAHYPVPPPGVGSTVLTDATSYSAFSPFAATPGGSVGQIVSQDVGAILRYNTVAGISTLTGRLVAPSVDQTSEPMMVSGALVPVGADQNKTLSANIPAAVVASRFAAQMPAVSPPTQSWRIDASPGYSVGLPIGFLLAGGAIAQDATSISATYASPFSTRWHPTITYTANSQRSFSLGANSTTMNSSLQVIAEAAPSLSLDAPAGLPTMTAINKMPLNADGMTVSLDVAGPVYVDITSDRTENTLYEVTVVEIAAAETQITRTSVGVVTGIDSHLPLPPGILQRGHTYYLQVTCTMGGYAKAASGDLQTFALPVSRGYQEGAVFTIAP